MLHTLVPFPHLFHTLIFIVIFMLTPLSPLPGTPPPWGRLFSKPSDNNWRWSREEPTRVKVLNDTHAGKTVTELSLIDVARIFPNWYWLTDPTNSLVSHFLLTLSY